MPANPFKDGGGSGGGSGKLKVPSAPSSTDPNSQVAQQFARGLATLKKFDPAKASKLELLYKSYGPDIPPGELTKYGLTPGGDADQSFGDQLKRGAGGLLGFVGKQLSRPGQAVLGAINPKQEGDNALEGFQRGLTGKDNQTLAEALGYGGGVERELGLAGKLGFKIANFVGTAAVDPLSYVTFGAGNVAKQGLSATARAAGREVTEQVAKKGLRSLEPEVRETLTREITEQLGEESAKKTLAQLEKGVSRVRFMGLDTGLRRGMPIRKAEILGQAEIGARLKALREAEGAAPTQLSLLDNVADLPADLPFRPTLTPPVPKGPVQASLFEGAHPLEKFAPAGTSLSEATAAQARAKLDELTERTLANPMPRMAPLSAAAPTVESAVKPPRFNALKEGFVPRASITDPAERSVFRGLVGNVQGSAHAQTLGLSQDFVSATKGMSRHTEQAILEAVQSLPKVDRQGLLDLAKANPEWKVPLESLASAVQRTANPEALGRAKGLGDVFEHTVTQPIRQNMRENLQQQLASAGLRTDDLGLQKAVDDWAEVAIKGKDPALAGPLSRATSTYRRLAVRTPGYFVRNAMTDYLSALTQVLSQKYGLRDSVTALRDSWGLIGAATKNTEAEWVTQFGAKRAGYLKDALRTNTLGSDVYQDTLKGAVSSKRRALSPLRAFDPVASKGAQVSEHARLSLFIASRESGLSPDAAADVVKKTLGDYSDYTVFEKKVLRDHAIPFYKFHRFNTPFQLAKLVTSPRVASAELTAQRTFANAEDPLPGALPLRLAQSPVLALGGGKFLQPSTGLDAALQATEPFTQIASNAPLLSKIPGAEQLQGDQGLTGKGILGLMGGPTLGGITKTLGEWTTSEDFFTGAPLSDRQKWQKLVRDMLPEFGRAMRFSRASEEDLPNILLSVLGGVSTIDVTDAQMRGEVYRRLDVLKKLLNDAEVDGQSASLLEQFGVTKTERGDLPTLTELRESGQVPELPKLTQSKQANPANPFK